MQLAHRRDINQLHGLKRVLADRLWMFLERGEKGDLPFIGEKESPADVLEKLSRVTARLIPLERQAFNLDAAPPPAQPRAPGGAVVLPADPIEAAKAYQRLINGGA